MKFTDPFQDVIKVVEKLYGKQKWEIYFDSSLGKRKGSTLGYTCFPIDGSIPYACVSSNISVDNAVEILVHEIAHLICGVTEGHGKKWENTFIKILKEYNRYLKHSAKAKGLKITYN
jgi:hypothetical protein